MHRSLAHQLSQGAGGRAAAVVLFYASLGRGLQARTPALEPPPGHPSLPAHSPRREWSTSSTQAAPALAGSKHASKPLTAAKRRCQRQGPPVRHVGDVHAGRSAIHNFLLHTQALQWSNSLKSIPELTLDTEKLISALA